MIDALNWQIKQALKAKGDLQEELSKKNGQNDQLKKENDLLRQQLKNQSEYFRSMNASLLEQQDFLKKVYELVQSNNKYLQPNGIDSLQISPKDSTSRN
jgi:regulator of replication initiation timing